MSLYSDFLVRRGLLDVSVKRSDVASNFNQFFSPLDQEEATEGRDDSRRQVQAGWPSHRGVCGRGCFRGGQEEDEGPQRQPQSPASSVLQRRHILWREFCKQPLSTAPFVAPPTHSRITMPLMRQSSQTLCCSS